MLSEAEPGLNALTERIIGAAFAVANALGHGFLEVVYRNALFEELSLGGISVKKEQAFPVHYRGRQVGLYVADLVVEDRAIVELKAIDGLAQSHAAQVLNYLKASGLPVGLLMNFGRPKIEIRRIVLAD
jgi:GxxExxY protein